MDVMEKLFRIQERFSGRFSLFAEHLGSAEVIQFGSVKEPMETASVMKLPILVDALRQCRKGRHHLDDAITYYHEDFVEGSGVLQHLSAGISLPLRDVLTLMIIVSDNVATNMVLRTIGIESVNRTCEELGLRDTSIKRRIDFRAKGPLALSTAYDLVQLLKGIYQKTALDPVSADIAKDILAHQQYNTLLTRDMPYELLDDNEDKPAQVIIASKSGSLTGIRNDAGLLFSPWGDYAIAIMSADSADQRFHVDTEAHVILPEAARAVFDHFIPAPW